MRRRFTARIFMTCPICDELVEPDDEAVRIVGHDQLDEPAWICESCARSNPDLGRDTP